MQKTSQKITEAIILAGGFGTRLQGAVPGLPKSLAPINGRPFLSYIIDTLRMQGIQRIIFSLGHRSEQIQEYLQKDYPFLDYTLSVEKEPLGTGGGIQLAMHQVTTPNVLVANGDTLFRVDVSAMARLQEDRSAETVLALKPMKDFDRYGMVRTNGEGLIISFEEKRFAAEGLINGGVYLVNVAAFLKRALPQKFSFEKDYLEKFVSDGMFYGLVQEGYFIDIGIPSDFEKAAEDLRPQIPDLKSIDKSWTLFLDRDGVINEERVGQYVLNWKEFIFNTGVLEVFRMLTMRFGRIILVSNQRGVGKGLMSEADLQSIHLEMQREVAIVHGRIDKIYYCTDTFNTSFNRKPNPGMALQAKQDFPDIDLSKSIMVGNKPSDMRFGRSAGMVTAFVRTTNPDEPFPHPDTDMVFTDLYEFAQALQP